MKKSQKHVEKIEKEKQGLKVEIQSSLIALQHTKSELHEIRDENIKLTKTLRVSELNEHKLTFVPFSNYCWLLQDSDSAIEKLKKQLDSLISDKELITTQITRKGDEIELLNQKINMMQMALDRSRKKYTS